MYAAAKQLRSGMNTDIRLMQENLVKTYGVGALTPQGIATTVHLVKGARTGTTNKRC